MILSKYCDDHCCYVNEKGICEKCEAGLPGHIRSRDEVNQEDHKRIADLEKRGLIKKKVNHNYETKEQESLRLAKRKLVIDELDKRHEKTMEFIKNEDWDGLERFEADLKPIMEEVL